MRRLALAACLIAAAACGGKSKGGGAVPPAPGPLTPAQIAERSLPSVVLIVGEGRLGTGFVVAPDGRIATNLHVIYGTPRVVVQLPDGRKLDQVEVLAVDPDHDLAVIRVPGKDLPALPLGDSDAVRPGDRVVAIGHPLGLGNTVSDGLVSAVRELDAEHKVLQISAPIAQGSSGGPLLDERGQVIGVAFLVAEEGQNLNFAVPVNYLKPMLEKHEGMAFEEFARRTAPKDGSGTGSGLAPRARPTAPRHDVSILDDCPVEQLQILVQGIEEAISLGAPLYNEGKIEMCYRLYEGTANDLARKLQGCSGVKKALGDGVAKAQAEKTPKEQAWAMRDTFDGLLLVIEKKYGGGGGGGAP